MGLYGGRTRPGSWSWVALCRDSPQSPAPSRAAMAGYRLDGTSPLPSELRPRASLYCRAASRRLRWIEDRGPLDSAPWRSHVWLMELIDRMIAKAVQLPPPGEPLAMRPSANWPPWEWPPARSALHRRRGLGT